MKIILALIATLLTCALIYVIKMDVKQDSMTFADWMSDEGIAWGIMIGMVYIVLAAD